MKRYLFILAIFIPVVLFSQEKKGGSDVSKNIKSIPVQAQYSDIFSIKKIYFNKTTDLYGKGDVLEVQFELKNKTDDPIDLYIFVIATYEKTEKTGSSFETIIPEKERIRSFVPYPFNLENFQYPSTDDKGKTINDNSGKATMKLIKYPKDTKLGVNPNTSGAYHLKEKLVVRTSHLSRYRNNYYFFNEVSIVIFNKDGEPQFKENYKLINMR